MSWQPIDTAPKGTWSETPHGLHVQGEYLLGFMPAMIEPDCPNRQLGISVIWWEPRGGPRKQGAWVTDAECIGNGQVFPSHWMPLPKAPAA